MKRIFLSSTVGLFFFGLILSGEIAEQPEPAGEAVPDEATAEEWKPLLHGIRYREINEGDGKEPALWAAVYVHYRLVAENGMVLADTFSSESHGRRARKYVIGSGTMPEALELAVGSMRERGQRSLMIPADLLQVSDFHTHAPEQEEHDAEEHDQLVAALQPGTTVKGELSLLWVRRYDPSSRKRFR